MIDSTKNGVGGLGFTTIQTGEDRFGNPNNSISLPLGGGVQTIIIPHEVFNGLEDFTISFWVNVESHPVPRVYYFGGFGGSADTRALNLSRDYAMVNGKDTNAWLSDMTLLRYDWTHIILLRRMNEGRIDVY